MDALEKECIRHSVFKEATIKLPVAIDLDCPTNCGLLPNCDEPKCTTCDQNGHRIKLCGIKKKRLTITPVTRLAHGQKVRGRVVPKNKRDILLPNAPEVGAGSERN